MPRTVPEWRGRTDDAMPTTAVRIRILAATGGRCACCGRKIVAGKPWALDHIKPLADGGENREGNLQPLCDLCHGAKTAKEATERAKGRRVQAKHLGIRAKKRKMPYRRFNGEIVWPEN